MHPIIVYFHFIKRDRLLILSFSHIYNNMFLLYQGGSRDTELSSRCAWLYVAGGAE